MDDGESRGFGFIKFTSPLEFHDALQRLHGFVLGQKPLQVSVARRSEPVATMVMTDPSLLTSHTTTNYNSNNALTTPTATGQQWNFLDYWEQQQLWQQQQYLFYQQEQSSSSCLYYDPSSHTPQHVGTSALSIAPPKWFRIERTDRTGCVIIYKQVIHKFSLPFIYLFRIWSVFFFFSIFFPVVSSIFFFLFFCSPPICLLYYHQPRHHQVICCVLLFNNK